MKKIYILLMHTNTIPSKLVRLFTRYPYSHVGISLNKECTEIYSFGRKNVNNIIGGGFSIEKKTGDFFNKFNKTTCRIFETTINDKQYKNLTNKLYDMKKNIEKYKYDYLGIIPRFFGIPITIRDHYVCSYFIASLLEETKIYNFEKNTCMVIPKDFENLDGFNEIYQGIYMHYDYK